MKEKQRKPMKTETEISILFVSFVVYATILLTFTMEIYSLLWAKLAIAGACTLASIVLSGFTLWTIAKIGKFEL